MDETVKLYPKKSKMALMLVGCLFFVVAGVWMILSDPASGNALISNPVVKIVFGAAACLMGLFAGYFSIKAMMNKQPALLLSPDGIHDNSSAVSFGFIPWSDVSDVYENSVQSSVASRQRFVVLGLIDPEKYLARQTNSLKKLILTTNQKMAGSPVTISSGTLGMKHDALLALIRGYFQRHSH